MIGRVVCGSKNVGVARRQDYGHVVRVAAALAEAGVEGVDLADTVGYGNPAQVRRVVRSVRSEIGETFQGLHLHDTMGLGLANALAGAEEGVRHFDSALAGLGGCPFAPGASGNIVTEDLVFMVESMGFDTGIDLPRLLDAPSVLRRGLPAEPMRGQLAKARPLASHCSLRGGRAPRRPPNGVARPGQGGRDQAARRDWSTRSEPFSPIASVIACVLPLGT